MSHPSAMPSQMVFEFLERLGLLNELARTARNGGASRPPMNPDVASGVIRLYDDCCKLHSDVEAWERLENAVGVEAAAV